MNAIEFISAGAGSGKTYRLTSILSEAMVAGAVRPSGVLAMTFTLKAAAELRQRARNALLESGRLDLSTAIGQSRIGTVNAVCSQLLRRYSFELGMSPEQTVLSETQSELMLRRALDDTLDSAQREALVRFGDRFCFERNEWDKPVRLIVDAARANGIDAVSLRALGPANADAMLQNWPAPAMGDVDLTAALTAAARRALLEVESYAASQRAVGKDPPNKTLEALTDLKACLRRLEDGTWTWRDWAFLAVFDAGAKVRTTVQPLVDAAGAHERHPEFHSDVRQYLSLVFGLAADTLASYEGAKRVSGAQDFIDQEMLLLKALHESPSVRASLAEELDLVLVDEFQDTSPIQLAVFVEMAKLAKRSVWVGDPKQAIYGFRGTDASLIAAILEAIPSWGGTLGAPLTQSRRSVPSLVALANAVFTPAFSKLKPEDIVLTPVRDEHPAQPSLLTWTFASRGAKGVFQGLGAAIAQLLSSGLQVQDNLTNEWRPVEPGDVVVLCRYNADIPQVAAALHAWGVPCVSSRPGLLSTPEAMLVVACLRRLLDASDTVATALIISLTDSVPAETWLEDRLKFVQSGVNQSAWRAGDPGAHPLVARLESLRERLAALTPFEALSLAKAESCVPRAAAQWSSTPKEAAARAANVEALMRMAETYEDECCSSKRPATVPGLLQWFALQAAAKLDARAAATSGAVEVSTHHSAKGLEWPVVILTGIDAQARTGLWDVRTRTDGAFDAQEPLRGRFVHYWPRPYGARRMPDILRTVQASRLGVEMQAQARDEHVRLLYVSCTRARDVMVLAVNQKSAATAWTDEIGASGLLFGSEGKIKLKGGEEVRRHRQVFAEQDIAAPPPPKVPTERRWPAAKVPCASAPLWLRPSEATTGAYCVSSVETVGARIAIAGSVDMVALGSAVHNAIALCIGSPSVVSAEAIDAILGRWGVGSAVESDAVRRQAQALMDWVARKWPGATLYVEVPVEVRLKSGSVVRGQIDLLMRTADGWILVDHKSDPRSSYEDHRLAETHGSQLNAYAEAIFEGTGRQVLGRWLFLPVAAQVVEVAAVDVSVQHAA